MLRVLDLFSGIGGFSLGLHRSGGFETVAFCEIEEYQRCQLRRLFPGVPVYEDVRGLSSQHLTADGVGPIDVICGGFPCQDVSCSGRGAGLDGERSGLWREYSRLIGELRPRYVIVENSAYLRSRGRGLNRVLGDLAALGYDAEWHCIPASYVGARHRRDRIWIVAYPAGSRRAQGLWAPDEPIRHHSWGAEFERLGGERRGAGWLPEPGVGRLVDGVPDRLVKRAVGALGNAVVPLIPELIGRAIIAGHPSEKSAPEVSGCEGAEGPK